MHGVQGAVLIFDEAHNIEDACREAGSVEIYLHDLREVGGHSGSAGLAGLVCACMPLPLLCVRQ